MTARRQNALIVLAAVVAVLTVPVASVAEPHRSTVVHERGQWTDVGPTAQRRAAGSLIVRLADGRVLIAGGGTSRDIGCKRSAELYDPRSGTWTETDAMRRPRCDPAALLLEDGRVLVAGGFGVRWKGSACPCTIARRSTEIYEPRTGTWSAGSPMIERRGRPMSAQLPDGRVMVAGGSNRHFRYRTTAEIYDPGHARWVSVSSMRSPHSSMIRLDHRTLLVTGDPRESATRQTTAERYRIHRGVWQPAGLLRLSAPSPVGPRLVRLTSGGIMAVSGRRVHRYAPAANDWTRMPSLPPRVSEVSVWSQQAVRLRGRPLVLSSHLEYDLGQSFGVGHIWRPARRQWVRLTTMPRPLDGFHAIRLGPREILVATGVARYLSQEGGDHVPTRYAALYRWGR